MEINNATEPNSLKEAFQSMIPDTVNVIQGKVISSLPLKIQVINDDKLILSENILCLPRHLTDYQTNVDISGGSISGLTASGQGSHQHSGGSHDGHSDGDGAHSHNDGTHTHTLQTFQVIGANMTIHNALKVGEIVYILSFNQGKKYYVLDRGA